MEYRENNYFDSIAWRLQVCLMWVGIMGIAWKLFKPGGWFFWSVDLFLREQPDSYYYLAVGIAALVTLKKWIDAIDPQATRNLLSALCAFAGTLFILSLFLPL